MKQFVLVLALVVSAISINANARVIYYGSQTELVNLVYNEPTIFRFSSLVKTVSKANGFEISPVDTNDPDYSTLSVKPLKRWSKGKLLFVLDNGEVVKLRLKTVGKEMPSITDSLYDLKSKKALLNNDKKSSIKISELELMKAMIRGHEVSGYKLRKLVRTIRGLRKGLVAKLVKVYTGDHFNGYVFGLANESYEDMKINVESIRLGSPNLAVMAQIDNKGFIPSKRHKKNWALLRIVAKPSSVYKDVVLPVGQVSKEDN